MGGGSFGCDFLSAYRLADTLSTLESVSWQSWRSQRGG